MIQAYCFRFYFLLVTVIIFGGMVQEQKAKTEQQRQNSMHRQQRNAKTGTKGKDRNRSKAKEQDRNMAGTLLGTLPRDLTLRDLTYKPLPHHRRSAHMFSA